MTLSEVLARHVSAATFNELPRKAVDAAKRSLIDTLGVALAARGAPGTGEALALAKRESAAEVSTIWSTGTRTSPRLAAFINSVYAGALDYDSLHPATATHPDIVIVPVVLAVGESEKVTGKNALTAIVIGDDLLCRMASSTRANSGWFYTSLHGGIVSAAVTAKLLKARESGIADAMGLAFVNGAATQQPIAERNLSKRALAAFSAASGVFCGCLAAEGFKGPREIFEGGFGLYRMYEDGDATAVTKMLGQRFENVNIAVKPYPSCQGNHAAIDGLLKLQAEHQLKPSDVAQIQVRVSPYTHRLVGARFDPTDNPQVAAQFSMQYSIACAMLRGQFGIGEIQEDVVLDPEIGRLARRIIVNQDPQNGNNYVPVELLIRTTDGRLLTTKVETLRGSAEAPFSAEELREKFLGCLEASGRYLTNGEADSFMERIERLEQETDLCSLLAEIARLVSPTRKKKPVHKDRKLRLDR